MNYQGVFKLGIFTSILALVSLSCGAADLPFLATATPTPTSTYTPSPTFTPSQTPTLTPTQTPSPTHLPTGVEIEEQSDGSTLFIDYDNQYQFVIPTGWFVIPLSSEDIVDILKNMSDENPEFKDTAEAFAQLDPEVIRVIALNEDTKYIANGFATNFSVTAIEDKLMSSMPLDFVTGAVEESLEQQGAKLLSDHELTISNANGVELGVFEFEQPALTATGASIQVRSRVVIFQTDIKLIMIQIATPLNFGDELLPILDDVADSVKLLGR